MNRFVLLAVAAAAIAGKGIKLLVADLPADRLLQLADLPEMKDAVILNARAEDDRLRVSDCRANVFHTSPNRAMKADALAQYLAFKRWTRWVLVSGSLDGDKAFADAIRRAAKRYGAKIVEERSYEFQAGSRRSDTGEQQVQKQMTQLTQRLPDYDVMIVADESEVFGEYLPYRIWDPRPVVRLSVMARRAPATPLSLATGSTSDSGSGSGVASPSQPMVTASFGAAAGCCAAAGTASSAAARPSAASIRRRGRGPEGRRMVSSPPAPSDRR